MKPKQISNSILAVLFVFPLMGTFAQQAANSGSTLCDDAGSRCVFVFGQTLIKNHLLDELKLWIHLCFVGRGKLLFQTKKTNFKLIPQKTLATGVIVASYQPVTA